MLPADGDGQVGLKRQAVGVNAVEHRAEPMAMATSTAYPIVAAPIGTATFALPTESVVAD